MVASVAGCALWELLVEGESFVLDYVVVEEQGCVCFYDWFKRELWGGEGFDVVFEHFGEVEVYFSVFVDGVQGLFDELAVDVDESVAYGFFEVFGGLDVDK